MFGWDEWIWKEQNEIWTVLWSDIQKFHLSPIVSPNKLMWKLRSKPNILRRNAPFSPMPKIFSKLMIYMSHSLFEKKIKSLPTTLLSFIHFWLIPFLPAKHNIRFIPVYGYRLKGILTTVTSESWICNIILPVDMHNICILCPIEVK